MNKRSDYTSDFIENCGETCSELIEKYCLVNKNICGKIGDVVSELGGICHFHPVLKNEFSAVAIFDHYREKLIDYSNPCNGFTYYCEEQVNDEGTVHAICTIMKSKRTKLERSKMIIRAVVKVIIQGPPSVGFMQVYQLPCKAFI